MKKSIFTLVVCVALFLQVNQSAAKVPNIQEVLKDPTYDPLSPTARKLVATILDHIQHMLRNQKASDAMVNFAVNSEKILISQTGQDSIMAILDLVGFMLKNPNASKIISIWCDKADTLVTTQPGRKFLRAMILSYHRVLSSSNVVPAATALMDGIEAYLRALEPAQIIKGMKIMKESAKGADVNVPESEVSKLQSRDISSVFEYNKSFQPHL